MKIQGRTLWDNEILYLGHTASYVEFYTCAQNMQIEAIGLEDTAEKDCYAALGVWIDGKFHKRILIERGLHLYPLFAQMEEKSKKILIMKLTEAQYDKVGIHMLYSDEPLSPTENREHRILVYGDSISCGFAVMGENPEVPITRNEDASMAYPCLTARELEAELEVVARSGSGIISQYIDVSRDTPLTDWLIPEFYMETDRSLAMILGYREPILWDPNHFIPEVIVVNLGSNDASYTRKITEREDLFLTAYRKFLKDIRANYQDVPILCICGTMITDLCDCIQKAAEQENQHLGNIYYSRFPQVKNVDGTVGNTHPVVAGHRSIAERLAFNIREILQWK